MEVCITLLYAMWETLLRNLRKVEHCTTKRKSKSRVARHIHADAGLVYLVVLFRWLSTLNSFLCSVSSLKLFEFLYLPRTSRLPPEHPCRLRTPQGHYRQPDESQHMDEKLHDSSTTLPLGWQKSVTSSSGLSILMRFKDLLRSGASLQCRFTKQLLYFNMCAPALKN